ncbi:astakine-like [Apis florea]|uniref:astakine-like n=1 Tax=Apis florea TaxID=7463 RepID=UPI0006299F84|nr:astakine-like [Apis florea]
MMTSIFVISFLLFVLAYPCHTQNDYIKCQTSSECRPNHCCTLGPIRYSIPQCKPMQGKGEVCRPTNVTFNVTLGYPDGSLLKIEDVHFIFCPCIDGFSCEKGVCKEKN